MIKECPVLLNTEVATVILYDDYEVQIPAIKKNVKTVRVKDDGLYTVVPNDYVEPGERKNDTHNVLNEQPKSVEVKERKARQRKKKSVCEYEYAANSQEV